MSGSDYLHPEEFGLYHGTRKGPFKPGDIISGGYPRSGMSNPGKPHEHVYHHTDVTKAAGYADTDNPKEYLSGHPAVYKVQPLDKPEMDPDFPAFTGNFRSKQARVIGQVPWGSRELTFKHPHESERKLM